MKVQGDDWQGAGEQMREGDYDQSIAYAQMKMSQTHYFVHLICANNY